MSERPVTRRRWLGLAIGLCAGAAATPLLPSRNVRSSARAQPSTLAWRERALLGFGTTLWIRAAHTDPDTLEAALDQVVATIRHIERQMSLFDADSALVQLNRDGALDQPDVDLVRVLKLASEVSARTDGAFDITVQPLWQTWRRAQQQGRLPTPDEIDAARRYVDWRAVEVSAARIALRPGMAITLNGIAQGYAADSVKQVLLAHGIEHAAVDTGEWTSAGASADGTPWTLGIADPRLRERFVARLFADGRGVASSDDDRTRFSDDRRHHHILDPRTGYSPTALAAVTIAAPSCALADALTKVLFMTDVPGALAHAARWGVDALLTEKSGRWHASAGLTLG